jgi:hypothetical protein
LLFAALFLLPGLLIGALGVGILAALVMNPPADRTMRRGGWLCGSCTAGVAFYCLAQGIRELRGRRKQAPAEPPSDAEPLFQRSRCATRQPPLIPKDQAESLVRAVAEKYRAKGTLRKLGAIPQKHLDKAAAHYAHEMEEEETPLALLDTSFLQNHTAGLLLTNRGLYSSFRPHPIWLCDIEEVSFPPPPERDVLASLFFGRMYRIWYQSKHLMKQHMLVNGELVYAGNQLRAEYWIELLLELAATARQERLSPGGASVAPSLVVLEASLSPRGGQPAEVHRVRDPVWQQIEQSIRDLDQDSYPSLRIWAGEPGEAPALEILGGNDKCVLRELGDGWTYYDPSQGEEEIEVCTGDPGYRCPAFYVCTDLRRVLEIAHHYFETGTPE